jgi:hypothetical protein
MVMTMMDVGAVLAAGLEAAEKWEGCTRGSPEEQACAERATGALVLLNSYLESGAPIPLAWLPGQARPGMSLSGWASGPGS